MEEKEINTEILIGDAGIPVDVKITVWYSQTPNGIIVHDSEDEAGIDNYPNWWPERIKQIIEESFENQNVIFS